VVHRHPQDHGPPCVRDGGAVADEARHLGTSHDEVSASQHTARNDSVEHVLRNDEDEDDQYHLAPLTNGEVAAGTPQVLNDEAGTREEQQCRQKEARQDVEVLDGREVGHGAEQGVDEAASPVHSAEDLVIDNVELQLHVADRGPEESRDNVAGAEEPDLPGNLDFDGQLALSANDLQHAI